ncbi:MAG: Uncharacterized protein Q1 colocalized with Q, partial [uncultured Corynebacteriales bacterium]
GCLGARARCAPTAGAHAGPRRVRRRRPQPAADQAALGGAGGGGPAAAAARPVDARPGAERPGGRRGGGDRPAGAAARPERLRGVGRHHAPGRVRLGRAGAGDGRRPAAARGRLELADGRAARRRGGAPRGRRDGHPDLVDPLRRPGRAAADHRPGAAGVLDAGRAGRLGPPAGVRGPALHRGRPAPGRGHRAAHPAGL